MHHFPLTIKLFAISLAFLTFSPANSSRAQEQTPAQRASQDFRDRFTKLRDDTKRRMREQAVRILELEQKVRSAGERSELGRLYEDRRDIVFEYYEAKIKALNALKNNHPSTSKSVDRAIASTKKNFSRDLGYIDQRQSEAETRRQVKPETASTKTTKPKAPAQRPTKRTASTSNQARIGKLKKQIRDLQFKIDSMKLRKGEALVEYRRAKSNFETASSSSDKRRKKSLMDQANRKVWKHRTDIKKEEIKLRRYQGQLKTIGG